MKKLILTLTLILLTLSGCTQLITAPIGIAGAATGAVVNVATAPL